MDKSQSSTSTSTKPPMYKAGLSFREQYHQYLQSADWKRKRATKHRRSSGRCAICGSTQQLDVHHLIYRRWHDVKMSDLRLLCRRCHEATHFLQRNGSLRFTPKMDHHGRYARMKYQVWAYLCRQQILCDISGVVEKWKYMRFAPVWGQP